jgi:hypothetical protein
VQFVRYWRDRAKESLVKARVRADAAIFAAFLISGVVGLWLSKFPVDKTVWWTGFIVFAGWLIIEICFIGPYRHTQLLTAEIKALKDRMKPRLDISVGKVKKSFMLIPRLFTLDLCCWFALAHQTK